MFESLESDSNNYSNNVTSQTKYEDAVHSNNHTGETANFDLLNNSDILNDSLKAFQLHSDSSIPHILGKDHLNATNVTRLLHTTSFL